MPSLPLFPLGTVLLPGAPLPLVIFEPRYVALLADLNRTAPPGQRAFGVVAIRKGHEVGPDAARELHDIGCEAVIEQVTGDKPPFHLIARGRRRFRVIGRDTEAATEYLTGRIDWIDGLRPSPPAAPDPDVTRVAAQVLALHRKLLKLLNAQDRQVDPPSIDDLAYRIVERTALDVADRQRILEGETAADRLHALRGILRREAAIVGQVRAVPGRIDPGSFSPN
jgi:Lon protease-like protein